MSTRHILCLDAIVWITQSCGNIAQVGDPVSHDVIIQICRKSPLIGLSFLQLISCSERPHETGIVESSWAYHEKLVISRDLDVA
jgi:hypothetical protein